MIRLGMLTPSSNTVLEPVTTAMLAGLPHVSVHFSRFRVTEIALTQGALAQFDPTEILRAAELLAHAKVDVIGWNGTSASWLGLETDRVLCARITAATGIPATTSMLAMHALMARLGVRRLGLVTPYLDDVQAKIIANLAGHGIEVPAERHAGLQDNFAFADVSPSQIEAMIRDVAAARPDAIAVVCTNMRAGPLVARLETELAIPILDSIATVVSDALRLAGGNPAAVTGWGWVFEGAHTA